MGISLASSLPIRDALNVYINSLGLKLIISLCRQKLQMGALCGGLSPSRSTYPNPVRGTL